MTLRIDETAQQRFDRTYITSSEVCKRLGVTRPAIHFRRSAGKLPDAIHVYGQHLVMWEREEIEPSLKQWEDELKEKRTKAS